MPFEMQQERGTKKVMVYTNPHCDACGTKLEFLYPTHPEINGSENLHFNRGVVVRISGGYGMYLDGVDEQDELILTILLCEDCAWNERAFDMEGTHSLVGKALNNFFNREPF